MPTATLKSLITKGIGKLGYTIKKIDEFPSDIIDNNFKQMYPQVSKYSCLSVERMYTLYNAVDYVVKAEIPGDIVECGVWKGGACMLVAETLLSLKTTTRKIFLYDTFKGMTQPNNRDIRISDAKSAKVKWEENRRKTHNSWMYAPFEEVKENMLSTGYPKEKLVFVKGSVEETLPKHIPDKISILRLDTDLYNSTYHELKYLFPKLSKGGILILDDYGAWKGARDATDDYFKEQKIIPFLQRTDVDERVFVKL